MALTRNHNPLARRRGLTLIELLVTLLILGTCLAALVSMWYFAYNMTTNTDDKGVAYNLGRRAVEEVKQSGFQYTPVGAVTPVAGSNPTVYTGVYTNSLYYDGNGANESATQSASSSYRVDTAVTTLYATQATGVNGVYYRPSDDGVRRATVTVVVLRTGQTVFQTGTLLVRAGV